MYTGPAHTLLYIVLQQCSRYYIVLLEFYYSDLLYFINVPWYMDLVFWH